jgi:FAD binding domain
MEGRLENARQFHDFLCTQWQRERPDPPYLRDVAGCELAYAEVRVHVEERSDATNSNGNVPRRGIRRRPGIVLLNCAYDIRPIFEEAEGASAPAKRDTPTVVVMPPGAEQPRIFELPPAIFELISALDDWTEPAEFGAAPELKELVQELAEHGLLEVRGQEFASSVSFRPFRAGSACAPTGPPMRCLSPRWQKGGVAIIGDAAHGLPPTLGQGVGLTLMNAHALVAILGHGRAVDEALPTWEAAVRFISDRTQRWALRYGAFTRQ